MAFDIGGSVGGISAVLGSSIMWLFGFMLVAVWIAVIIWLIWREAQYKHKAVIMFTDQKKDEKNVKKTFIVRMRKITKKGILKLKKFKTPVDIPEPDFWQSIGKKQGVFFQYDGRELFVAVKPTVNSPVSFTPAQYDIMDSMVRRKSKMAERHGTINHWDKYGHYYVFFGTVFLMVLAMYFVSQNMGDGFSDVARALESRKSDLANAGTEVLG